MCTSIRNGTVHENMQARTMRRSVTLPRYRSASREKNLPAGLVHSDENSFNLVRSHEIDTPDKLRTARHKLRMRKTLTARQCETLSCPSPRRRIDYRDTVVPGLCLRVTATEQATVIDFIDPVTGAVDEIRVRCGAERAEQWECAAGLIGRGFSPLSAPGAEWHQPSSQTRVGHTFILANVVKAN